MKEDKVIRKKVLISEQIYKECLHYVVNEEIKNKNLTMRVKKDEDYSLVLDMLDSKEPQKKARDFAINEELKKFKESSEYIELVKLGFFAVDSDYLEEKNQRYVVIIFLDMNDFSVPSLENITISIPDIDIDENFINLSFKDHLLKNSTEIIKNSSIVEKNDIILYDKDKLTKEGHRVVKTDQITEVCGNTYSKDTYKKILGKKTGDEIKVFDTTLDLINSLDTKITIKKIFATRFSDVNVTDYKKLDNEGLKFAKDEKDLKHKFTRLLEEELSYEMIFSMGEEIMIELVKRVNLFTLPIYFKFKYYMLADIPLRDKDLIEDDNEENRYLDLYKIILFKLMNDLNLEPVISDYQKSLDIKKYCKFSKEHLISDFDMETLKKIYKYLINSVTIE